MRRYEQHGHRSAQSARLLAAGLAREGKLYPVITYSHPDGIRVLVIEPADQRVTLTISTGPGQ